jgi:serine/threonine-protein kinase
MPEVNEVIGGYKLRSLLQTGQVSQVFEVIEPISNRHFAMKFFPSGSMRTRLMGKDFTFIKENARKIFKQAATGLAYMHASGWVHCDVKPDNMLVNAAGDLKWIDFAISRRIPKGMSKLFYRQAKAQGTPSYMSPEQIRRQALDGRADVYGLGATFYELLTARPPFRGNTIPDLLNKQLTEKPITPQAHNKDVTDEFSALVLKMLSKKREERPATCHDVLIAMRKMKVLKTDPDLEDEGGGMM